MPTSTRFPSRRTVVLLAVLIAWAVIGIFGVTRYLSNYWLYRGFPAPTVPAGVAAGTIKPVHFFSQSLGHKVTYDIFLPPHYAAQAAHGRRFPVVYLLHPPPGLPNGMLEAGAMAQKAEILMAKHAIGPMILVNPLAKTSAFGDDTEWDNTPAGNYDTFMTEVVHHVDRHFATKASRRYRALSGVSMGGYGAINLTLHHPGLFSIAESWSGYFFQTPTGPYKGATPAQLRASSPYYELPAVRARLMRTGVRAFLFQGTHDDVPLGQMVAFAHRLSTSGGEVRYAVYPGGHDWRLWRGQVVPMLKVTDHWFKTPPHPGRGSLRRGTWAVP